MALTVIRLPQLRSQSVIGFCAVAVLSALRLQILCNQKTCYSRSEWVERGLYFICLNTNIGRQFEFIQHAWANNSKFDGLYNDVDPIVGFSFLKYNDDKYVPGEFTMPDHPVRKKVSTIPQFVFTQGGAYFFIPGLQALQLIANADKELAVVHNTTST